MPIARFVLLGLVMGSSIGCDINTFVLFPERDIRQTPEELGLRYETIEAANAAGHRVHGWLILPDGKPRGAVLVSHGNAGNVGSFLAWGKLLADAGYAAALYDYQGYGQSEGEPDVTSLAGDGEAVVAWLREHGHIGPGRGLGLLGLSLGTLVSTHLAGVVGETSAVCLEGAMIPGEELKRKFGVVGAGIAWVLVGQIPDELNTDKQIARVSAPLLFLHSPADEVTSLQGARDLYELANEPKRFVEMPGTAHLTPIFDWPDYSTTVSAFFGEHLK